MSSTTSSVTFFTSWSGCGSSARIGATARSADAPSSAALARLLILVIADLLFFCGRLLPLVARLLVRLFLPRRAPIVDQIASALQVGIALEYVLVERRLFEDAARLEQVGARLDEAQPDQAPAHIEGLGLVQRIGVEIEAPADAVAYVARAEDRQHEIRPGRRAPAAEGLAEVLVVLLIPHVR